MFLHQRIAEEQEAKKKARAAKTAEGEKRAAEDEAGPGDTKKPRTE